MNRSSNMGQGISNNSFRDRLKGFKGAGNQAGAASQGQAQGIQSQTQGPAGAVGGVGGGSSATNENLQKRLADMKAKLHGLRGNN